MSAESARRPASERRRSGPTPIAVRRALRDIGDHLGAWRRLQGLKSEEVADRAGISRGTLSKLESGRGASLENTLRVARALGVLDGVVAAFDPMRSDVGRLRADERLPQRVRRGRGGSG